jgi:ketosteroid isomerase-like protein
MSQENVAVVRDVYAAFNRGELSEMVACLTEDFVFSRRPMPWTESRIQGTRLSLPGSRGWVSFGAASS